MAANLNDILFYNQNAGPVTGFVLAPAVPPAPPAPLICNTKAMFANQANSLLKRRDQLDDDSPVWTQIVTYLNGIQLIPANGSNPQYTEAIANNTLNGDMLYHASRGKKGSDTLTAIFTYDSSVVPNRVQVYILGKHIAGDKYEILWCANSTNTGKEFTLKERIDYQ